MRTAIQPVRPGLPGFRTISPRDANRPIKTIGPGRLLANPKYFLNAIDIESDRAIFLPTSRALLSEVGFLDGRDPIATGARQYARLSELVRLARPDPTPDRFIFHVSFCGSTLLSRLVDVPGRSLVLKEPNCLVDLANWKTFNTRGGRPLWRLDMGLQLARCTLKRRMVPDEVVVTKPSNWTNNLLDNIAEEGTILPLFVTIGREAFLLAVLRGGSERLTFTARLASHLAAAFPDGDHLLHQAVEGADDPLGRAVNLAAVAHHLQEALFAQTRRRGGWGEVHHIHFDEIINSPFEAAWKASRALRLDLEPNDIERNVAEHVGKHSKSPAIAFSADRRRAEDEAVTAHHHRTIDASILWSERTLRTADM